MAGPLQKLRDAVMRKDPIEVTAETIKIGDVELARKAKTNFKSMRGRGAAYPLDAVYFQYKFQELPYNRYIAACSDERADHVKVLDKNGPPYLPHWRGVNVRRPGRRNRRGRPRARAGVAAGGDGKGARPWRRVTRELLRRRGERLFVHRDQRA